MYISKIKNTFFINFKGHIKGSGSHLQTIPNMNFGIDEKYTLMIMKSHRYVKNKFEAEMKNLSSFSCC